jgi:dephospho-CoA kinase
MKLVGLGGGIGSGKSSTSALLAARGAVIVDADLIARQVVAPASLAGEVSVLNRLVERFGPGILLADKTLNRQALAELVFPDPESVKALNAITHPAIGAEIERQIAVHHDTDHVVILDAPLLFDRDRPGLVGKVLVDVDEELAIDRLVRFRGYDEADARRRVAAQMSRVDRRAKADFVIDNSGSPADLEKQVAELWDWIHTLPHSHLDQPPSPTP